MKWRFVKHPVCSCTHALSMFCCILASLTLPKKFLPATPCRCGKTYRRLKDGKLFTKEAT